jgi:hypothetical protein
MFFFDTLMVRKKNDVLHPLVVGNRGNANGYNVFSHFKIFSSAVQ